jgi:beta-alanine degradation protein BauB
MSLESPEENPIGTELIKEDENVRIWRIVLEPGEEAPWHTHHLDYTSIVLEGSLLERYNGDGTTDRYEVKPGDLMRLYEGSTRHALKNVGNSRFSNVIVEIKEK